MLRSILTVLTLFALWLLLSGVYKPIIVVLGFCSCVFAVYMVRRMDNAADVGRLKLNLKPFEFIKYIVWLLIEIAKSNWAVTKVILSPEMPINQKLFKVPFTQKTDLGQTIFANSITLTPGTISVEVEQDFFWVHAVVYDNGDPAALADMDRRVTRTESAVV